MQVIPAEQALERRQYYAHHGISWVARAHDNNPGGYKRAGRFKKGACFLPLASINGLTPSL